MNADQTRDDATHDRALSYGRVAHAYDRGRPGYPAEAVRWLLGDEPRIILELGAGTGKLTAEMVRQGHAVHSTDPDEAMLEVLREQVPGCSARQGSAEDIPANDNSVDIVVVGEAFHWFDGDRALAEIARILRPGGHLAIINNVRDARIPWVKRLGRLLEDEEHAEAPEALVTSELFGFVEDHSVGHWHDVNRDSILDLATSYSSVASLDDDEREARLDEVLAFYDDYGRGMDGMQVPLVARCFRATVVEPRDPGGEAEPTAERPVSDDGDMLILNFD
jgi:ubiquinone/menaquinone biosynthesis C-methylase UbiE